MNVGASEPVLGFPSLKIDVYINTVGQNLPVGAVWHQAVGGLTWYARMCGSLPGTMVVAVIAGNSAELKTSNRMMGPIAEVMTPKQATGHRDFEDGDGDRA